MEQRSFASLSFDAKKKKTPREVFLAQVEKVTLFALSNLWMARQSLLAMTGGVRP